MADRKRTNNDLHEELEDTNGVIRMRKLKKNRQNNGRQKKDKGTNNDLHEELEDNNGVIRIRKLKKNRQNNGRQKKDEQ